MTTESSSNAAGSELPALLEEIVHDSETLVGQQLQLLGAELREELVHVGEAAMVLGVGTGLITAGGIFAALGLVHALHRTTRLSLGSSYALVGGLMGAAGAGLLAAGGNRAGSLRLPPPQTIEALQENLAWLKEQVT